MGLEKYQSLLAFLKWHKPIVDHISRILTVGENSQASILIFTAFYKDQLTYAGPWSYEKKKIKVP